MKFDQNFIPPATTSGLSVKIPRTRGVGYRQQKNLFVFHFRPIQTLSINE